MSNRTQAAKRDPFGPSELNKWMGSEDPVTVLSAARGKSGKNDKRRMQMLLRDLQELGIKPRDIKQMRGQWDERPEPSLAVRGLSFATATALSKKYDQDAFIFKGADGTLGMYSGYRDQDEGGLKAVVPTANGEPVFGAGTVKSQPRQPKDEKRGRPKPPPDELFTGTRSNTFEFLFDWNTSLEIDNGRPLTQDQVREQLPRQTEAPSAPEPGPTYPGVDAPGEGERAAGLGLSNVTRLAHRGRVELVGATQGRGRAELMPRRRAQAETPAPTLFSSYAELTEFLGREPDVLDVSDAPEGPVPGTLSFEYQKTPYLLVAVEDPNDRIVRLSNNDDAMDLLTFARTVYGADAVVTDYVSGLVWVDGPEAEDYLLPPVDPKLLRLAQLDEPDLDLDDDIRGPSWLSAEEPPTPLDYAEPELETAPEPESEPEPEPEPELESIPDRPEWNTEPPTNEALLPELEPNSADNIRKLLDLATEHETYFYRTWYEQAHRESNRIAEETGIHPTIAAGLVATLSPNMRWEANIAAARNLAADPEYYRNAVLQRQRQRAPIKAQMMTQVGPIEAQRRDAEKAVTTRYAAKLDKLKERAGVKSQRALLAHPKYGEKATALLAERTEKRKAAGDRFKDRIKKAKDKYAPKLQAVNERYPFTGVPQYATNIIKALDVLYNGPVTWSGVDPNDPTRKLKPSEGTKPENANITGPKVTEFYESIRDPKSSKKKLVLDGHAINIYRGDPNSGLSDMTPPSERERAEIYDAYQEVAREYGLAPQEVQAITWSIWRDAKKNSAKAPARSTPKAAAVRGLVELWSRRGISRITDTEDLPAEQGGDDSALLEELGYEVQASRMRYMTETSRQGEVEVGEARPGDHVKFLADFKRPGWPRVDAGTLGRVRTVQGGNGTLSVDVTGSTRDAAGAIELKRCEVPVSARDVTLMLHSEDARAGH